jgi:uncharacterized protein YdeI (YjbR/CyaY-like superfamily)
MGTTDPRVDAYIDKSADFARPILIHLRKLIHAGCPQVEETIKWGAPFFMYQGVLCGMAAFKAHCTFGFWKRLLMTTLKDKNKSKQAMGNFGRLTSLADLPKDRIILQQVREAARLNTDGVKAPKPKRKAKKPLKVPPYFLVALRKNKQALATFDNFSPSHQREYIEWITEAKTDATRDKRLATAVEWLAEGKSRNWKYEKC